MTTLLGTSGNDDLQLTPAYTDVNGNGGTDTIDLQQATAAVNVDLMAGTVTSPGWLSGTVTMTGVTQIFGSYYGGTLTGGNNTTYIGAPGGNTTVNIGPLATTVQLGWGNNTVHGGAGNDLIVSGSGSNTIDGGGGYNAVSYSTASGAVIVDLYAGAWHDGIYDSLTNIVNIIGNNAGDRLSGDWQDNIIVGGTGADIIAGREGNDTLTGGAGADTFIFAPNLGHVVVTDFLHSDGDRIDLSAFGTFHTLQDVLNVSQQVGANTVITLGSGSVTLDNVNLGSLVDSDFGLGGSGPPLHSVVADFNGDGFSDLIWQSKGTFAAWSLHDASIQAGISLGSAAGWQVQDVGDFSGVAGFSGDLLLRNTATGEVAVWTEANGTVSRNSLGVVPLAFRIVAAADFNGDGISDVLWRNEQSGGVLEWQMGPSGPSASYSLGAMSPDWKIVGAGDYNGDGKADILWRNAGDGEVAMWQTDGAGHVSASASLGVVPTPIQIVGSGDFNGDGKADILWRNANNGQMTIWEMNGAQVIGGAALYNPGTAWTVAGVEDVNGDGKADILLRNSSGLVVAWDMDGLAIDHSGVIGQVDPGWQIVNHHFETPLPPAADYNGDGKSDLIWQNNGTFAAWGLDDASVQSGASLGTAPGWQVQDLGDFSGAPGFSGDLLLRNTTTGAVAIWTDANGSVSQNSLGTVPLAFQIVAAADFNGDGTSDILWRNAQSGGVLVWQISGAAPAASYTLGSMPLDWNIVGAADYSGDGLADILWRNAGSGDVVMWQTDGAGHIASTTDLGAVPTAIQLVGSGDFNGDGKADILWRNANSGQLTIWEMNGGQLIGGGAIGNPGTAWTVAGVEDINGDGKADILLRNSSGLVAAWDMNGLAIDHSGTIAQLDPAWQLVNHDYHGF